MLRVAGAVETGSGPADLRHASTVVTDQEPSERRARPRTIDEAQLAAERNVEQERIASKAAQVADADYFTILGVPRSASDHELRRAHERLCADYDPSRFSPDAAAQHREALAEIREVLDEAARVLLNRRARERYAAHLLAVDEADT
jgi:hypothetical protein